MATITLKASKLMRGCDAALSSKTLEASYWERVNNIRKACFLASELGDDTITLTEEEASLIVTET